MRCEAGEPPSPPPSAQLLRRDTKRERQESVCQEAQGFVPTVHIPALRKMCGAALKRKKKSGQIPSRTSRLTTPRKRVGLGGGTVGQPDTFHDPSSSLAFLQLSTSRPPSPPSLNTHTTSTTSSTTSLYSLSAFCPPGWMTILFVLMGIIGPDGTGNSAFGCRVSDFLDGF